MIGFYNYTVILTYIGTISGIFGIFAALEGKPSVSVFCLLLSGLCDMFDGFVARTRERNEAEKKFGIQIDSLSDLLCFGFLPIFVSYTLGMNQFYQVVILLLYFLGALIRLAYFNVMEEERQSQTTEKRKYYEGLPVTSVAGLFPLIYVLRLFLKNSFVLVLTLYMLVVAILFVSKIKIAKPSGKGLLILLVVGISELALLLWGW